MKASILVGSASPGRVERREVEAFPVKVPGWEGYEFFVHRSTTAAHGTDRDSDSSLPGWVVSEAITGCAISDREGFATQKEAVKSAKAALEKEAREGGEGWEFDNVIWATVDRVKSGGYW